MIGADVYSSSAVLPRLESVNVVALRRERVYPSGTDDFIVRLAHQEALSRSERRRLAVDFEIAYARFSFKPKRAYAYVRMAVRRQESAGFKLPLHYEKGLSAV